MKNTTAQLNKIMQNNMQSLYVAWGTESMILEEVTRTFINRMKDNNEDDMNISHFNLTETSIDDVIYEAESYPFFGEKKLIIVHSSYILTGKQVSSSVNHSLELLETYITNPSDFSIVVFLAPYDKLDKRKKVTKLLLKHAEVIEATPASDHDTATYLKTYAKEEGYHLSRESLALLMQLTDRQLTKGKKELEKLMLYHSTDKHITDETIHKLVSKSLEQNIFELNERVLKKNVKGSIELYQDLLNQKEDPIKIIALMIAEFRLLLQVKILRSKGYQQADIASLLKVHPYRIKLAIQKEKAFPQSVLSQAHHLLIDTDYDIKTGRVNPEISVELFIWKFSTLS